MKSRKFRQHRVDICFVVPICKKKSVHPRIRGTFLSIIISGEPQQTFCILISDRIKNDKVLQRLANEQETSALRNQSQGNNRGKFGALITQNMDTRSTVSLSCSR
jgi:hypothetical protein